MRRAGRPGLLGTMARTAVVAGTASATAGAVNRRQQERAMEQQQAAAFREQQAATAQAPPPPPAPAAPAAPAAGSSTDQLIGHLTSLGSLHEAGVLTDEEFNAAKARLLTR